VAEGRRILLNLEKRPFQSAIRVSTQFAKYGNGGTGVNKLDSRVVIFHKNENVVHRCSVFKI
jgi:protein subunit release factor B